MFAMRRGVQRCGKYALGGTAIAAAPLWYQSREAHAEGQVAGVGGVPVFTIDGNRHDQSMYMGRFKTMLEVIDPRTLFTSEATVKQCQELLKEFKKTGVKRNGVTDEEMWDAKRIVNAVVHPVTEDVMFWGGRMSSFVPLNIPIMGGMITMSHTPALSCFWQIVNQSYNVVNNYVNRSSAEVDWGPLMQSYGLAVSISAGIALGFAKMMQLYPGMSAIGPVGPYLAVISAGSCNVGFTRMDEIKNGVPVFDADGNNLGISIKAGQTAVFQTITTRSMALPIVPLLLPPILVNMVSLTSPAAKVVFQITVLAGCLCVGLPAALAIQPQQMTLSVNKLEPQFQNLKDAAGNKIDVVFANKGL
jgi:tricarboxylate carrier